MSVVAGEEDYCSVLANHRQYNSLTTIKSILSI